MVNTYMIVGNRAQHTNPDYTRKSVEDKYYSEYKDAVITWPLPKISLARIRHAFSAARQAFATFTPAPRN